MSDNNSDVFGQNNPISDSGDLSSTLPKNDGAVGRFDLDVKVNRTPHEDINNVGSGMELLYLEDRVVETYIERFEKILEIPELWVRLIELRSYHKDLDYIGDEDLRKELSKYFFRKAGPETLPMQGRLILSTLDYEKETAEAKHTYMTALVYFISTGKDPFDKYADLEKSIGSELSDLYGAILLIDDFNNTPEDFQELFFLATHQRDKVSQALVIRKIVILISKLSRASSDYDKIGVFLSRRVYSEKEGSVENIRSILHYLIDFNYFIDQIRTLTVSELNALTTNLNLSKEQLQLACLSDHKLRTKLLEDGIDEEFRRIVDEVSDSEELSIYQANAMELNVLDSEELVQSLSMLIRFSNLLEDIDLTDTNIVSYVIKKSSEYILKNEDNLKVFLSNLDLAKKHNFIASKLTLFMYYFFFSVKYISEEELYQFIGPPLRSYKFRDVLVFFAQSGLRSREPQDDNLKKINKLYQHHLKSEIQTGRITEEILTDKEQQEIDQRLEEVFDKEKLLKKIFLQLILQHDRQKVTDMLVEALGKSDAKILHDLKHLWEIYCDDHVGLRLSRILKKQKVSEFFYDSYDDLKKLLTINRRLLSKLKSYMSQFSRNSISNENILTSLKALQLINEVEVYYLSGSEEAADQKFIEELNKLYEQSTHGLLKKLSEDEKSRNIFIELFEEEKLDKKYQIFYIFLSNIPKRELINVIDYSEMMDDQSISNSVIPVNTYFESRIIESVFFNLLRTDYKESDLYSIQTLGYQIYSVPKPLEWFQSSMGQLRTYESKLYSSKMTLSGEQSFLSLINEQQYNYINPKLLVTLINLIDTSESFFYEFEDNFEHKKLYILGNVIQLAHEFHLDEDLGLKDKLDKLRIMYVYLVARMRILPRHVSSHEFLERVVMSSHYLTCFSDIIDNKDRWQQAVKKGLELYISNNVASFTNKYFVYEESEEIIDAENVSISPINFPLPNSQVLNEAASLRLRSISGMQKLGSTKGEYVAKLAREHFEGDEKGYFETRDKRQETRKNYLQSEVDSRRLLRTTKNRERYSLENFYEYSGYADLDDSVTARFEFRVNTIINYFLKNYNIPEPLRSAITNGNRAYYLDYSKLYSSQLVKWLVTLDHKNYSSGFISAVESDQKDFEWLLRLMMFDIASCVTFRKDNKKRKNKLLQVISDAQISEKYSSLIDLAREISKCNIEKREENLTEKLIRIINESQEVLSTIDLERINKEVEEYKYVQIEGQRVLKSMVNIHLDKLKRERLKALQVAKSKENPPDLFNQNDTLHDINPDSIRDQPSLRLGFQGYGSNLHLPHKERNFIHSLGLLKIDKEIVGGLKISKSLDFDNLKNNPGGAVEYSLSIPPKSGILYPLNFPYTKIAAIRILDQNFNLMKGSVNVDKFGGVDLLSILEQGVSKIDIVETRADNYDQIKEICKGVNFIPWEEQDDSKYVNFKQKDISSIFANKNLRKAFKSAKAGIRRFFKSFPDSLKDNFENFLTTLSSHYARFMYDIQPSRYGIDVNVEELEILTQIFDQKRTPEDIALFCNVVSRSLLPVFTNLNFPNYEITLQGVEQKDSRLAVKSFHSKNIVLTPWGYYLIDFTSSKSAPGFDSSIFDIDWQNLSQFNYRSGVYDDQFEQFRQAREKQRLSEIAKEYLKGERGIEDLPDELRQQLEIEIQKQREIIHLEDQLKRVKDIQAEVSKKNPYITEFEEISRNFNLEDLSHSEIEILSTFTSSLMEVELSEVEEVVEKHFNEFNKDLSKEILERVISTLNTLPSIETLNQIEEFSKQEFIANFTDSAIIYLAQKIQHKFQISEEEAISSASYIIFKNKKYKFENSALSISNLRMRISELRRDRRFQEVVSNLKNNFADLAKYCLANQSNKILILFVKELLG